LLSRILALLILAGSPALVAAEPADDAKPGEEVLARYLSRSGDQRMVLRDVSMEVDIEAELPMLKKQGKLHALRHISRLGKVTYEVISFIGDNMVKKDVIARYMAAEVRSSGEDDRRALAVNDKNYRFRYRGMYGRGDWRLHLFEIKPRRRKAGLFNGWLWVEADSGLPVRESGRFVKNPSVFLKRVEFVRDYHLRDGVAVPVLIESTIQTRIVGRAKLQIRFGEVSQREGAEELAAHNWSLTR
jgi:hypothetical protein